MLREILDPSKQISDQFRTHVIVVASSKVIEGCILDHNERELTIAIDPKSPAAVVQIPADGVDEMVLSKTSLMPKDLLNAATKEETLDLLAYIESGGDPRDANFRK